MTDLISFLKSLLSVSGLSGYEDPSAHLIEAEWRPLVDELTRSRLGSLHGYKKGTGGHSRPSIMLASHMDAIGLMVSHIVNGFLYITPIGGIDMRILPGQAVIVHTGKGALPGVVVMPPAKLLPPETRDGVVDIHHLFVDVGLLPSKVAALVQVGDLVSFGTEAVEMPGEIVSGHSLDNRASIAAVTLCLQELQNRSHAWDVWAVATVQEEISYGGSTTSTFQLRPDLSIAIDVTFAKGPGANDWQTFEMGKGPTFGHGPNIHPFLQDQFKKLADEMEIPYSTEIMPSSSGTDGMAMQITAEGIPNFVLSIPIRYMHTPVEVVAVKDIRRAGRLLAGFIAGLDIDFMQTITWDEK